MAKTQEELNALKEEVEALNRKLHELTEEELAQVSGGFIAGSGVTVFQVNDTFYDKKFKGTSYKVTTQTTVSSLGQVVPVEISQGTSTINGIKTASYLIYSCTHS